MRAEHDSRQALVRALHMADDIAKRILAQLHARLTHQPHQICAAALYLNHIAQCLLIQSGLG